MASFRNTLAAGFAFALTAGAASATTTTPQTVQFGPALTDFSNATRSLSLFDSTLGMLTSITITSSFGFNSTITVTNTGAGASNGTVRTETAAGFTSDTSAAINNVITSVVDGQGPVTIGASTLNDAAYDAYGATAPYAVPAGGSQTVTSNRSTQRIGPFVDTMAADLAAFSTVGGGSFNVIFNTLTGTLQSNTNGNSSSGQTTTATGTFGISYSYTAAPPPVTTPVPEPASMALLGAGLVGLGMLRRKKQVALVP